MRLPMRGLALLLPLVVSCGDGLQPGEVSKITLTESGFTFTALGQNHLLVPRVTAGEGSGTVELVWSSSNPAVVKVNGDGLATAIAPGTATVRVSHGTVAAEALMTVAQTPAAIVTRLGDRQTGVPGQSLIVPLTVSVTDALGWRVAGVPVSFGTMDPGASVSPDTATTDFFGQASTTLFLGPTEGNYHVSATVTGTALATSFTALADSGGPFNIELVFVDQQPTAAQAAAFASAEARWESVVIGDLPDDYADLPAYSCGANPAISRPLDDLIIFVQIGPIDGPGGILGAAGPCFMHEVGLLPAVGTMIFDQDDLLQLEWQGTLTDVVTHEMGHVLGIGSIWSDQGLLADPVGMGGTDPHFTGALAVAAFDAAGGAAYLGGKVPVEDMGGPGTADAHWRESIFDNELMTGYIATSPNPLSAITIASLADLGYTVDPSVAEPFSVLVPLRRGIRGPLVHLQGDVLRLPVRVLPRRGKGMVRPR